jgi:hypothetical protein
LALERVADSTAPGVIITSARCLLSRPFREAGRSGIELLDPRGIGKEIEKEPGSVGDSGKRETFDPHRQFSRQGWTFRLMIGNRSHIVQAAFR